MFTGPPGRAGEIGEYGEIGPYGEKGDRVLIQILYLIHSQLQLTLIHILNPFPIQG